MAISHITARNKFDINLLNALYWYSLLADLTKGHVSFYEHLASVVRRKLSYFWNFWTKLNQTWQTLSLGGPFQMCVQQPRPPFKMTAVTRNKYFFNGILLLHYKLIKMGSNFNCNYFAMSSSIFILDFSVKCYFLLIRRYIPITQIRYILIKYHT